MPLINKVANMFYLIVKSVSPFIKKSINTFNHHVFNQALVQLILSLIPNDGVMQEFQPNT